MFQVVLLDEDGEILGSRYLKSGECLEAGKKCTFPNYLIEIGEAKNLNRGWFCASHSIGLCVDCVPVPPENS
jgi:hypothetical protein